jgi:hypothetical protein
LLALLGAHHILHVSRIRVNWDGEPTGYEENPVNWDFIGIMHTVD